jgi:hypothetical protein
MKAKKQKIVIAQYNNIIPPLVKNIKPSDYSSIDKKYMKRLIFFLISLVLILIFTLSRVFSQTISTAKFPGSKNTIIFIISELPLKNHKINDSKVFPILLKNRTEFNNKFSNVKVSFNPDFLEILQDKINIKTINLTYKLYSLIYSPANTIPPFDNKVLLQTETITDLDVVDLNEEDVQLKKISNYLIQNKYNVENIKDFILELKVSSSNSKTNNYSTSRNYLINIF